VATRVPVLVVVAYLLLGSAWLFGNPPGGAPDEPAHYLKALGAGRGDLHLGRRPPPPPDLAALDEERKWHAVTARLVRIPPGLDPSPLPCSAFHPEISAGCLRNERPPGATEAATIVGPYQPFTYVVPGLLMRAAEDPESATRFGRLGFWLPSAALLGLSVALLWAPGQGGWWLIGLAVAVTPMVAFMVSTLSANGLEIAAGLCFAAALLRLARGGDERAWVWAALAAGGALLALARVTGVLWVVLSLAAVVCLTGVAPARSVLRRGGRRAVWAAAVVGSAVAATVAWELAVQPRPRRSLGAAVRGLRGELGELPEILDQAIGIFGWLDTRMPTVAYATWKVLLLALLVAASAVGTRRQRLAVAAVAAGTVVATVGVATLNRATGFGAQARYVLPFLVVLPLAAGEVLLANRARVRVPAGLVRWLPVAFVVPATGVHLLGWYANARRHAVGVPGPWAFIARAEWSPPLGWSTWLAVTGGAAFALVLAAFLAAVSTPGGRPRAAAAAGSPTTEAPAPPAPASPPTPGRPAPAPRTDGS
jgi:hypothetical protein